MADRQASPGQQQQQQLLPLRQQQQQQSRTPQYPFSATASSIINKLQEHVPNSTQSMGLLALAISGGIMLLLSGITLTATVLGLIFFTPIIIITSPIWVPVAAFTFVIVAGILFVGGFGAVSVVGLSWLYRYYKGFHPVGSGRIDYARSRIADTASHMKDYAREYGGYLQSKVKDAAPGA